MAAWRLWGAWALMLWLFAGCASTPSAPREITLAGVVVDAQRVAAPGESGLMRIERGGYAIEARAGMALQPGDVVMTGPHAFAVIRYPSGSELFMRPNTRGRVGSFTDMIGEVFAKIRGAFAVQTTFVKAGAEGTAYAVRSTAGGEYAVVVFDGTVRLSSLTGAWPPLSLGAGTMGAGRPQVPPRAMAATPEELSRTSAWVERLEQLVPAPRTGSGVGPALAIAGLAAIIIASQHDSDGGGGLAAPTGLHPAGPSAQQPATADGCYPLTLRWNAVRGARDYVATLEPMIATRLSATGSSTLTTVAPTTSVARAPSGLYRWRVHARDNAGKAGPDSATVYFRCP